MKTVKISSLLWIYRANEQQYNSHMQVDSLLNGRRGSFQQYILVL